MEIYKTGEAILEWSVPISVFIQASAYNKAGFHPIDPPALPYAFAGLDNLSVGAGGVGFGISPLYYFGTKSDPDDPTEPETPYDEPVTRNVKVGVVLTLLGLTTPSVSKRIWLDSQAIDWGGVGTASATYTTTLIVSRPVDNCIEIGEAEPVRVIDAPFPTRVKLFQRYSFTSAGSATAGGSETESGLSQSGTDGRGGDVSYAVESTLVASAGAGGGGSWSAVPSGEYFAPDDTDVTHVPSVTDANGSATAGHGTLSLSSNAGQTVRATVYTAWNPIKRFSLGGVVRAMEQAYPDTLQGVCSKFAGDTTPTFSIMGGAFSVGHDQRRGIWIAGYEGVLSHTLASVYMDEWQPVRVGLTSASLEAVGEDLSPPSPAPDPDTGQVSPFAEAGPPRATRMMLRGRRFGAMSLDLSQETLIDNCATLTPSGAWAGSWQAQGSGAAPTLYAGGVRFGGGVKRIFTHDVSLSSYRFLRLHLVYNSDTHSPLHVLIGGKPFKVVPVSPKSNDKNVSTDDYYFVDMCAEAAGPPTSLAGTKWPLRQQDYPITSDGLPKYEKSYLGVSRCQSIVIVDPGASDMTLFRLELSRRAFYGETGETAQVTFLPAFYRGRLIYENGPTAPPTGLDRPWPTREFPTRHFGDGTIVPPDESYREDLSGDADEYDGYDEAHNGGGGSGNDGPSSTNRWDTASAP